MPRVNPGPPCVICEAPSIAKGLCPTHYKRMARHGRVDFGRPDDWGKRAKHPLNETWSRMKREGGRDPSWDDFWIFVAAVGERPTSHHQLRRANRRKPYGPDNWFWSDATPKTGGPERERRAAYARDWRVKNPFLAKNAYLKKRFGINIEQYQEMLEAQGGGCAICGGKDENYSLAVDHCHATGRIRGLLHSKCNQGIGLFGDSPDLLRAAAAYLERHALAPAA